MDNSPNNNLVNPPKGKDSIKGKSNGHDIYVVHANKKAYPQYFVRYLRQEKKISKMSRRLEKRPKEVLKDMSSYEGQWRVDTEIREG